MNKKGDLNMSEEIALKLAAVLHYQSNPEDAVDFKKLPKDEQKGFVAAAQNIFNSLDRLNLEVVPKVRKAAKEEAAQDLQIKVENVVNDFFKQISVWKKGMIPQGELVLRIVRAVS